MGAVADGDLKRSDRVGCDSFSQHEIYNVDLLDKYLSDYNHKQNYSSDRIPVDWADHMSAIDNEKAVKEKAILGTDCRISWHCYQRKYDNPMIEPKMDLNKNEDQSRLVLTNDNKLQVVVGRVDGIGKGLHVSEILLLDIMYL